MTQRATFINQPYGAYHHRDIPKEDVELTHVGPGTPCGEYLRRFWNPVATSDELKDVPLRIRIMGEDLIIFRDLSGRVGLMEPHCAHRGTSLEFGLLSERGIRCCYHGWLYDVDGTILETPGEPDDSTLRFRLCHGAYPTREHRGLVFAYMGPQDKQPPFPIFDTLVDEGTADHRPSSADNGKHYMPCNWLQIKENCMDPVHTAFLHTIVSGAQFTEEFGVIPELDFIESPVGMAYIATRRVGDNIWVRMNDFIAPNVHQVASSFEDGKHEHGFHRPWLTQWSVPVDDKETMNIRLRHYSEEEYRSPAKPPVLTFGQTGDRDHEARQRVPGDYDALSTIHWGMSRYGLEHLGYTDRGVIMLRNMVRTGIRDVQAGRNPFGSQLSADQVIRTYANDTVVRAPAASSLEKDAELLHQTGLQVARGYIENPPAL